MVKLNIDKEKLEEICRRYGVNFLGVFGSVVRGDDQPGSDMDFLVRFAPDSNTSLMGMVRMEAELEQLLGRKIDLVTKDFLSKYFREDVLKETQPVYGQA